MGSGPKWRLPSSTGRGPVFSGLTWAERTRGTRGEGGEDDEVRWGHPGPRRTSNTHVRLRAVEGSPLPVPTGS